MKKICSKCKLEKDIREFHKDKTTRDGYKYHCKVCLNKYNCTRDNSESQKRFRQTDKYKEYQKKYKQSKKYKEQQKIYKKTSSVAIEYNKRYVKSDSRKRYIKEYLNRPHIKLKNRLRCRLYQSIRNYYKSGSAIRNLGCSVDEFRTYIESKFTEGMTWDNWSKQGWHLDHIKPLSSYNLSINKDLLEVCHYTNLQPLWWFENLKKSNKIINNHVKDKKL